MKMSHEYVLDGEARAVTHHLPLRSLATIEEEGVSFPLKGDRTHVATHGRARRSGAEECDSNHALSLPDVLARRLCPAPCAQHALAKLVSWRGEALEGC